MHGVVLRAGILAGIAGLAWAGPLAAQESPLKVGAAELQLSGRVQAQFNTTSVETEPTTEALLRRVRLEAKVKINELVSAKIQPEFAGSAMSLKDAYVQLDFSPGLAVRAGQSHRPFSRIELTSSTRIMPIERGLRIRGVDGVEHYELVNGLDYSERDIGVQLLGAPAGAPLGLGYQVGVFAGPLQGSVGSSDSYQVAARATLSPAERLSLGAGWSSRDFARPDPFSASGFTLERGSAFELDFEYGAFEPGLHLIGELAFGDANPFTGAEFLGMQGWAAFRSAPTARGIMVEPVLRASYGDVDDSATAVVPLGGTLLTPGINIYLAELSRVMLNYDFWLPDGDRSGASSFRAQFQVAF